MGTKEYGNDSIKKLVGAQRLINNPGNMLGDNGLDGCKQTIIEILGNALDEKTSGFGDRIDISLYEDGSISIRDYGRGVPLGWNEKAQDWNWNLIYNELYAGGKYDKNQDVLRDIDKKGLWDSFKISDHPYLISVGMNGLGCAITQYSSKWLTVKSYRNGEVSTMKFVDKVPAMKELLVEKSDEPSGTFVHWKPDGDIVFTNVNIPVHWFEELCRDTSILAGIDVVFNDKGREKVFKASNIKDFMREVTGGVAYDHDFKHIVDDRGDVCICDLEVAVGPTSKRRDSYYNMIRVSGGAHATGQNSAVGWFFDDIGREVGIKIKSTDYADQMSFIISTLANKASSRGQTKDYINDTWIATFIADTLYKVLRKEHEKGTPWLESIVERVVSEARARIAAQSMTQNMKAIETSIKKHQVSEKFTPCRSYIEGRVEETELFIVEGDSAKEGFLSARNSDFQCILPAKGKSLNLYKATIDQMVKNGEIADIIGVLGTGIDMDIEGYKSFDMNKLKVGKIILLADADIDGRHIEMLLTLIMYKLFRPLLTTGRVYVAVAPLYSIKYNDGTTGFAYDDSELEEALSAKGYREVVRNKGLGEMTPEDLWQSALNPATRRLVQIQIDENDVEVSEALEVLFGKSTEARKQAILTDLMGTGYDSVVEGIQSISDLIESEVDDDDMVVQEVVYVR